ncbi:hypothetical protein [Mycolicibacterium sp. 120270]|uniref:hypothetical protein n=1 Tax=Mycolicibacterium sp. 120270 TaxID=3090600 RepID=UPI00299F216F|nr:hypothetical protein [Mycolicibacterium sp. 120270]MDX1886744.1 hypothetical protein [Mycolicibacterium sp. 120270]
MSFGTGAVAAAAKTAHTISKFAKIIRSAVSTWKISKRISEGVKKAHDIGGVRKRLERIKNLGRKGKGSETPAQIKVEIPSGAPESITRYTRHAEERIADRDAGRGVRREALEDAFRDPVRDVERLPMRKDGSVTVIRARMRPWSSIPRETL